MFLRNTRYKLVSIIGYSCENIMWKLKVGRSSGQWVTTSNNHIGRQFWEFEEEVEAKDVEKVTKMHEDFKSRRFQSKQTSDLLARAQVYVLTTLYALFLL